MENIHYAVSRFPEEQELFHRKARCGTNNDVVLKIYNLIICNNKQIAQHNTIPSGPVLLRDLYIIK